MTVKKRLQLSNMLMIAVPVLIGLVFALGGFCALLELIERGGRGAGSDNQSVFWTSHVVAELAALAVAAVLLAVALAVLLMNWFLVRFGIRRIEQPLDMLAQNRGG